MQQQAFLLGDSACALPLYQSENYFDDDTLFSTAKGYDRQGEAGEPVPYTIRGDNLFTSLLLISFVVLMVSVSHVRGFLYQRLKNLVLPSSNAHDPSITRAEMYFQLFLVVLASLLLSINVFIYASDHQADAFLIADYHLVALLFGCFLSYFFLKFALYQTVNSVFFTYRQVKEWQHTILFLFALEGILLFPITLVQVYFDFSFEKAVYAYIFILFFCKILTFYKGWNIFFRQFGAILQIFLYFCTLEIVPLLALAGGIKLLIDVLKITF